MSRRSHLLTSLPAALLFALAAGPALAQWTPNGVQLSGYGTSSTAAVITSDGGGGAYVGWANEAPFNNGSQIDAFVQRVTAAGTIAAGWPGVGLGVCVAPQPQFMVGLVPDGAGGVTCLWDDLRDGATHDYDIYTGRVQSNGTLAPGWIANGRPLVAAPGFQGFGSPVMDGTGGAIVAYDDGPAGSIGVQVFARRILGDGTIPPGWPAGGLQVCSAPGTRRQSFAAADGAGGAYITWIDFREGGSIADTYVQRITGSGAIAPGWPADGVPVCTGGSASPNAVVADPAGGVYVVWQDNRDFAPSDQAGDVYCQHVLGSGIVDPAWPANGLAVCALPHIQQGLRAAGDGLGGLLIAWEDYRNGSYSQVYAARILAGGTLAPGWPANGRLVSTYPNWQYKAAVVSDALGGAYVGYESQVGDDKVYAQHLLADGTLAPGFPATGQPLAAVTGTQTYPAMVEDGAGGAIVAWNDSRANGRYQIYAQLLAGSGPVAVAVALTRASATSAGVTLEWNAAVGTGWNAEVERREADGAWRSLAAIASDGAGALAYRDAAVRPGARYAYRLTRNGAVLTPETWVDVPAGAALALAGFRPNPAPAGALSVAFTLPDDAPANLELLDLAGRRLMSREVGSLGGGAHVVALETIARVSPGLYWLRLVRGGETLAQRGAIVR